MTLIQENSFKLKTENKKHLKQNSLLAYLSFSSHTTFFGTVPGRKNTPSVNWNKLSPNINHPRNTVIGKCKN